VRHDLRDKSAKGWPAFGTHQRAKASREAPANEQFPLPAATSARTVTQPGARKLARPPISVSRSPSLSERINLVDASDYRRNSIPSFVL
jgi:hypothetical protein